jgi:hypothetical protein
MRAGARMITAGKLEEALQAQGTLPATEAAWQNLDNGVAAVYYPVDSDAQPKRFRRPRRSGP